MIIEFAPAKINLALHVRRRRPDAYHELETLFAFARHGDVVKVEPANADAFTMDGPFAPALAGEASPSNLVTRARDAFRSAFGGGPVAINLTKTLPVASGIGGGSADAAATLRALARCGGIAAADPQLSALAAGLGADVPACLVGRSCLGTGVGDALVPVAGMPGTPLLLVNPGAAVSTAAVFRNWDGVDRGALPDGPLLARAQQGRNDLAAPARAVAPIIGEVETLLASVPGTLLSRMSGSGATCFALFDTPSSRDAAALLAGERGWWTLASELAE